MKYFKLIDNDKIIGVITSNNFMHYCALSDCYLRANEQIGEYVSFKGNFYRSSWMQPYILKEKYKEISIISISEEEYEVFDNALKVSDTIQISHSTVIETKTEEWADPINKASIEFIRSSKISEMSYACRTTIEKGFDLEINGETHHFSLDTQDQLNLMSLANLARTKNQIPYHADGEECIYYTAIEINQIVNAATQFKIYHTTYYNALKSYINALDSIEEISAITYGTTIPEEYKTDVLKALE